LKGESKPMKTSANIEAVRKLCERWAWLSEEEFGELLAQNCIYYDVPFPRAQAIGPHAAHVKLSPMQKDWDIGLEVVAIVGDADTVIAERVEHFRNKTDAVEPFDLPVVGVFEIAAGKIKAWRDYWDKSAAEPLLRFIAMSRGQRTT
jgi:limonene-1,2-epoxide hydrolase